MRAEREPRPPELAVGAFGEKLRKQREQRGLALDAISNTTKISTRMLRALEDEHFDQLPGGVFNKGFVRAYARQVGLDEEETITEYLAALRESQVQSQPILPDFRAPGSKPRPVTPSDSRHHILPASDHPGGDGQNDGGHDLATEERRKQERRNEVRRSRDRGQNQNNRQPEVPSEVQHESARLAAGAQSHREPDHLRPGRHEGGGREEEEDRAENQRQESGSLPGFITLGPAKENSSGPAEGASRHISRITVALALLLVIAGVALWNWWRHRESAPAAAMTSAVSSSAAQAPTPTLAATSANSPKIGAASSLAKPVERRPSVATPTPALKASGNPAPVNADVAKIVSHAPAEKPAATFTVLIRAEQTTWVSITADGKPVIHETLIAPAHTSVRAAHDVSVRVGNAAGVSFLMNGKEFPAQGSVGEVRTYVFNATGLEPEDPSQAPIR
jgi:Helix-turn-helix domain/Domain of unknown function (DUF4115)